MYNINLLNLIIRRFIKGEIMFSSEIKTKFNEIGSKLYNLKFSVEHLVESVENESNVSLRIICLLHILKYYFNAIKLEYNKLEEELNVLL